jgi:PAS domain S-box-containing protein
VKAGEVARTPPGPARHGTEAQRLAALARYAILDTPREEDFDDIAELASEICDTPIAVVNLIADGRQWFKAEVGLGVRETPLATSFCGDAILAEDFMLVPDAAEDPRFDTNPLVAGEPGLRFYAGALLKTAEGLPIGTLCVLDYRPRTLTEQQIRALKRLARQVMSRLDQRRAEAALRESERRLATLVGNLPGMAYRRPAAEPWPLTYASGGALELTGRPAADFMAGEPTWMEVIHPDDAEAAAAEAGAAVEGRRPFELAYRVRHADGSTRWVLDRGLGVHDEATGEPVAVEGFVGDLTRQREAEEHLRELNATLEGRVADAVAERAKAEEALRQSQKMEAVGQLTGGVAHDFNNLLTIIRSSADLLRRPDLPEERRRRYVDAIADTVARASKLTGQLLAFARRQVLKPEVFDAAGRVEAVADMLRTIMGARVRITADIAREPCLVEADASQFETALINMAVNARDAMDGEGALAVRVWEVSKMPAIRGHRGGAGRFVAVSLSDTGAGIAPDKIGQIFEPFFTTKEVGKGTGLGLSQVYGFAKQSGGDVAVESRVGQGTTFTLYLPRAEREAADAAPAGPQAAAESIEGGRGCRVLVVEDNADVGGFSTQILQDLGYETAWAANASEALILLGEGGSRFDAVFSDVVMPGMSGVELGREVRRRCPGLPVVLTSGYSQVLAEEGRHGFELLQKPYAADELSRVLRRVTRGRRAE